MRCRRSVCGALVRISFGGVVTATDGDVTGSVGDVIQSVTESVGDVTESVGSFGRRSVGGVQKKCDRCVTDSCDQNFSY